MNIRIKAGPIAAKIRSMAGYGCLLAAISLVASCSHGDMYRALAERNRILCNELTPGQRDECLRNTHAPEYERYKSELDKLK